MIQRLVSAEILFFYLHLLITHLAVSQTLVNQADDNQDTQCFEQLHIHLFTGSNLELELKHYVYSHLIDSIGITSDVLNHIASQQQKTLKRC